MKKHDITLLTRIEEYCRANNLTVTRFGRRVMRDPSFVQNIRDGRKIREKTRQRVLKVIEA